MSNLVGTNRKGQLKYLRKSFLFQMLNSYLILDEYVSEHFVSCSLIFRHFQFCHSNKASSYKSRENIQKKSMGQTVQFRIL